MERRAIDEVEHVPHPMGVNSVRRPLSEPLGVEEMAIVYYELEPGEQFGGGTHAHEDQEEIFIVLDGTATFEVGERREENVTVSTGEAIRFAPGDFQVGKNTSDKSVTAIAIGAPGVGHDWDAIRTPVPCPSCDEITIHAVRPPDDGMVVYCLECGAETQVG
jgi:uncharacterized cupin superfamily protein